MSIQQYNITINDFIGDTPCSEYFIYTGLTTDITSATIIYTGTTPFTGYSFYYSADTSQESIYVFIKHCDGYVQPVEDLSCCNGNPTKNQGGYQVVLVNLKCCGIFLTTPTPTITITESITPTPTLTLTITPTETSIPLPTPTPTQHAISFNMFTGTTSCSGSTWGIYGTIGFVGTVYLPPGTNIVNITDGTQIYSNSSLTTPFIFTGYVAASGLLPITTRVYHVVSGITTYVGMGGASCP